jgi:hypothetical protein
MVVPGSPITQFPLRTRELDADKSSGGRTLLLAIDQVSVPIRH